MFLWKSSICIEILAFKLRNDPKVAAFELNKSKKHLLELYADDCSIFLKPDSDSLRYTIYVLNQFYKLSGLKVSVTKTKAIWFGKNANSQINLCPDLNLLGIEFDNNLENLEQNFFIKLQEIKKLLDCWIHRTLTVFGKITVIKSLALSKLGHLALVLPSLNSIQINELEKTISNFMWGGKPDKVSREHAKMSEKSGGLGMVDIKLFWTALKFSWVRRLCATKAFWPVIMIESIKKISAEINDIQDFHQSSPKTISTISRSIKNPFWKQVLGSITPIMQGALFCFPEKLVNAPFWDNKYILRNERPISKNHFPIWSNIIKKVADFFHPGTARLLNREEWIE